jgi:hypothetical protein
MMPWGNGGGRAEGAEEGRWYTFRVWVVAGLHRHLAGSPRGGGELVFFIL